MLVFLDADTEPGPEFLERLLTLHQQLGGLVTVQPLLLITRRVGRFSWINLIFPLPVLFFLGVFLLTILNLERGQVQWKGRTVSTR